jgi:hypothetical protein
MANPRKIIPEYSVHHLGRTVVSDGAPLTASPVVASSVIESPLD